ncbi:MAG: hypothetical protein JWN49_91 [Parcubacteria group bacterium]|nr:hypothetical protein [Parcubacteria group bacterium]
MSSKPTLRTPEAEQIYREYRASLHPDDPCALCNKAPATKSFTHWKIAENSFPYDRIAQKHDMLMPIRHVTEAGLTDEEVRELSEIKNTSIEEYNWILEPTHSNKSIPGHFHLHLIVGKLSEV